MSKQKVLLIGWDGADWKTINPLLEAGYLPNLERLVNSGTIGNLATLDPPYSPMLWTSIATGKRPYKHGVYGFSEPASDGNHVRPVLSTSRKCKAIWNILTQKNYRTHSVGWWPSHPAEPINGIAVSNFFQRPGKAGLKHWPLAPHSVWPPEESEGFAQLRVHPGELTGAHLQPFIPDLQKLSGTAAPLVQKLAHILAENASTHAAFTHILRTSDWDFATVYFDAIDRVCHEFMRYHPPHRPHIPKDQFDLYKDVVVGIYRFADMKLGRLLALAGEDTTVMLISDHGFQPDHLRPRDIPNEPAGIAYEHSPYGIFCAKGPGIKQDSLVHGASILDITPTLLQLFELPIGKDMDGVPLLSIFEEPPTPTTIDSWELIEGEAGMPDQGLANDQQALDTLLQQLVDLGYLPPLAEDNSKAVEDTARFCRINFARSLFDGNEIEKAIKQFEVLHQERPNAPWIAYRLAVCYQMIGEHAKCREMIEKLKAGHYYESPFVATMEASLLMGEGNYQQALECLADLREDMTDNTPQINLQIGRCYSMLGQPDKAVTALEKELEIDFDSAEAHQFLGAIHLQQKRYEQATEHLMTAISLNYSGSTAHYLLGRTLLATGEYPAAADAFKVALSITPFNNHARELLAYLYKTHLGQAREAAQLLQDFKKHLRGTVVVVSGLPRSGTSMLMQMLDATHYPIFTDEERAADENNPKGYYEHDVVKKLAHNQQWLSYARDKAVKIVVPLLNSLPYNYRYKIIFMERDFHEIYASQQRMLNRLGQSKNSDILDLGLLESMKHLVGESKQWAQRHPSAEVLYLKYEDVLNAPLEQALRISEFLGIESDPIQMASKVDTSLYRERRKDTSNFIQN